ncbi:MAG: hypothetical protein U9O87_11175, partial [Verrucomicrobiota bacterium]|nr:hypothetical protein [Verrucomicrobiota bacterium]
IKPDFVESRDDRLLVFTSLKSGKSKYYYTVRAITKGTYTLPPVYAECMYDPKIKSVGDFKNISVK